MAAPVLRSRAPFLTPGELRWVFIGVTVSAPLVLWVVFTIAGARGDGIADRVPFDPAPVTTPATATTSPPTIAAAVPGPTPAPPRERRPAARSAPRITVVAPPAPVTTRAPEPSTSPEASATPSGAPSASQTAVQPTTGIPAPGSGRGRAGGG